MPKVKAARKSTHIDMTAMTDVAFLLLTFFMLTAKMKPTEPVKVDTPSSISETKLPDANTIMILVDNKGKVYLDMAGSKTRYELIK
jgi:biopolymer transport protein ExbD